MDADRSEKARGHNSEWRKREAQGEVTVIRYADDFVIGFREESDARRCLAALKERFAKSDALREQLRRRRHADLAETGGWLLSIYRGWSQYYAVSGNYERLRQFKDALQQMWLNVLRRCSQRGRHLTWAKFSKLSRKWLPTPKILHPYPNVRFASQHPR